MSTKSVALMIVLGALSCAASFDENDRRANAPRDSWLTRPPDGNGFTKVESERFAVVVEELQIEAQGALSKMPSKVISADEAARLVGKKLPAKGEYVLLRALAYNIQNGAFEIRIRDRAVHVHHDSLGKSSTSMKRKAVVAVLPKQPESVYVTCGIAE